MIPAGTNPLPPLAPTPRHPAPPTPGTPTLPHARRLAQGQPCRMVPARTPHAHAPPAPRPPAHRADLSSSYQALQLSKLSMLVTSYTSSA